MTESNEAYLPGMKQPKRRKGRHELAADKSIREARESGLLIAGHADSLYASSLRALARQLDVAEANDKPYATATLARELREMLVSARMDPGSRAVTAADPFASLVLALGDD
jgi:hypothetical protein